MIVGRPRRFFREDVLKVLTHRSNGQSWREIGRRMGTSASQVYELVTLPRPPARDPEAWELLAGDTALEMLFGKAAVDLPGRPAAPGLGRARPGRGPHVRESQRRATRGPRSRNRSIEISRSESGQCGLLFMAPIDCPSRPDGRHRCCRARSHGTKTWRPLKQAEEHACRCGTRSRGTSPESKPGAGIGAGHPEAPERREAPR